MYTWDPKVAGQRSTTTHMPHWLLIMQLGHNLGVALSSLKGNITQNMLVIKLYKIEMLLDTTEYNLYQ